MKRKLLPTLALILLFAVSTFAQQNLLEKVELNFTLEGEPSIQEVGFENRQSFWKVKYELRLTDFSVLEKLGICHRDEYNRHICQLVKDKKINKQIKMSSSKIFKGSFIRKTLANEANRAVIIPIELPPDVIEVYNQATKIPEKNPTFILFVTQKISVKNSENSKLKEKYSVTGIKQLKTAVSNQNFEYWNVKNLSLNATIIKQENGQLKFIGGFVQ